MASFTLLDVNAFMHDRIKHANDYNLTNVTSPCMVDDSRQRQSVHRNNLGAQLVSICPDPDSFLFWDQVHPTYRVSAIDACICR